MVRWYMEHEARKYFDTIFRDTSYGHIQYRLEQYWLCALIGLIFNEYNVNLKENIEITDSFTTDLRSFEDEIRALVFYRFLHITNVNPDDDTILSQMNEFFDMNNLSRISTNGMKYMDYFASKGFDIIKEKIKLETTKNLYQFLTKYLKLIEEKYPN